MLRPLTALRFGAALLVFPWHAAATRGAAMHFSLGYAGVTFFYVLSGFILTHTYAPIAHAGITRRAVTRYAVARFARLYPVHVCAMAVTLAILATIGGDHWSNVSGPVRFGETAAQLMLLQAWFPSEDMHFGINGPAWSISVECFFYTLFPLMLLLAIRIFRTASVRLILGVATATWIAFALFLAGRTAVFDQWNLYVFPPIRLVDFFLGILLALAYAKRGTRRVRCDATLLETAGLLGVAFAAGCSVFLPQSMHFSAAFLPFAGLAIYVFALGEGKISAFLALPACVALGEASYAFYLLHLNVIHVVEYALHGRYSWVAFGVSLAASVVVALGVFTYVEAPLRRRIRSAWERRAAACEPLRQTGISAPPRGTNDIWQRYSATAERRSQ